MDLASARDRARAVLGPELRDSCEVRRPNPSAFDRFVDPETFRLSPDDADYPAIHAGPCLLRERQLRRRGEQGEGEILRKTWEVLLPATATAFVERDVVVLTASDNVQAVGVPLRVSGIGRRTNEVFRILDVEDDSGSLER